jgi:hypothetical protein
MGYTHYWSNAHAFTVPQWKELTDHVRRVFAVAQETFGISLSSESDINGIPIANGEEIRFNGYADEGHETFLLTPHRINFGFCKTARKPYDSVAVAVLMFATKISSGFSWSSDGSNEENYTREAGFLLEAAREREKDE